MRAYMAPLLALGVLVSGCSKQPADTAATATPGADAGMALETPGNTIPAGPTSNESQLAMGDPQSAVANDNANRVFFALNSAQLDAKADQQLDKIAAAYKQAPGTGIDLAGFTDTTGTRPYNKKLSGERAQAVKAYLVKQGVSANDISTQAEGQTDLNVPTKNGVKEPANRRVRIEFGDQ